jgi:hypothetical protein
MKPFIVVLTGVAALSLPHGHSATKSAEISIFRVRDNHLVDSLRTRRDGRFRVGLEGHERFYFRVRPTSKPYCHTSVIALGREHHQRVRVAVPTTREHLCETSSLQQQ